MAASEEIIGEEWKERSRELADWAMPPLDARIRSMRYAQELRAAGLSNPAGLVMELG